MISGASDEELDIAIARADVLLELQPKIDELKKENQKLKNQQKEFIQWLESEISFIKNTYSQINGDYMTMNPVIKNWIAIMEKILSKYKEIIGGKNERKN